MNVSQDKELNVMAIGFNMEKRKGKVNATIKPTQMTNKN